MSRAAWRPDSWDGAEVVSPKKGSKRSFLKALKRPLLRPISFVAYLIAIAIGVPAAVLLWNAAGWPLPYLWAARPALAGAGSARLDIFDGRSAVVINGDTIALGPERVRIMNIDAPESREPRCERELVAGLKAKERLAQLVRVEEVSITRDDRDHDGRTLAPLSAKGRDVGSTLISEGFVLPWRDGPQAREARRRYWCGSQ